MTTYRFDHFISQKDVVSCSSCYRQSQSKVYLDESHCGTEVNHSSFGYMPQRVEKKNFCLRIFVQKNARGVRYCHHNSAQILLVTDLTPVQRPLSIFTEVSSSFKPQIAAILLQSRTRYLAREVEGNIL